MFITTDMIPFMCIDLDEISLTATFSCDPDLDFSCSRSHSNFALKFALAYVYYYRHNTLCVERL